jgi:hypothetical protein
MTKKIFALVMVVSILGAFLAGCGSKDNAADSGSSASAAGGGDAKTTS